MRIRKRCLTESSLAPSPELFHHQQPNDPPIEEVSPPLPLPAPPRADLQLTLVKRTNGWICKTDDDDCMQSNSSTQLGEEALPNDTKIGKLSTAAVVHVKKNNNSGAEDSDGISSSASASHLEMESTMKIEINPTREEHSCGVSVMKKKRKKVDKESAMADGTRCSRVNGRGWRCWKPTVIGYSLCAHHSIQGRLKSKDEKQQGHNTAEASSLVLLDEEPLIMLKKRKKRIGMVKNRSISGLLAQTEPQSAPAMSVLDPIVIL